MFSIIGGRIFQRGQPVLLYFAFISGEVKSSNKSSNLSTIPPRQRFKIITAVSGFAKPKKTLKPYIPESILHGKVGEDAYFRAHYVGEICEDKLGKYSHLFNKRGGWNKRGGGAKVAKSINVEV